MTIKLLRIFLITLSFLVGWSLIVWVFDLPDFILPRPIQVFSQLIINYRLFSQHLMPTLLEIISGFFLGTFFGCMAAIVIAYFSPLKNWLIPVMVTSQAIPTFVIAPLFIIWLGYGPTSKILITMVMIFFPVASAFIEGLNQTPKEWLELATSMNASSWSIFWHLKMPAALPYLASGIKTAASIAPIGAIVGEWIGSSKGLGYLMLNANARLQIDDMFSVLIIVIVMSLLLYFCVDKLLAKWVWWKNTD